MKRKNRIPKTPIISSKVAPKKDLFSVESIVDAADRASIEAVERDYEGRSSDEEDGAIPMEPEDAPRRPSRMPRHNPI
jgi:hypothetical protein